MVAGELAKFYAKEDGKSVEAHTENLKQILKSPKVKENLMRAVAFEMFDLEPGEHAIHYTTLEMVKLDLEPGEHAIHNTTYLEMFGHDLDPIDLAKKYVKRIAMGWVNRKKDNRSIDVEKHHWQYYLHCHNQFDHPSLLEKQRP